MATNKNFEVKNGLTIAGTERITSAGVITGSHAGSIASATTATTQSASDNSTKIATTAYTDAAITALVDSSPSALNTLNELAAALGDDANYATTTTAAIAAKLPLAGGTLTGLLTGIGVTTNGARNIIQRANDDSSIAFANNASGTPSSHTWAIGLDYSASNGLSIAYASNGIPSLTGNNLMQITTDGKVGIGTTSPRTLLNLSKSAQSQTQIGNCRQFSLTDTHGYDATRVEMGMGYWHPTHTYQPVVLGAIITDNAGQPVSDFYIATKSSTDGDVAPIERFRITKNGHMGFGTTDMPSGMNSGSYKQFKIGGAVLADSGHAAGHNVELMNNLHVGSGNDRKYTHAAPAAVVQMTGGKIYLRTNDGGGASAGGTATMSQRMQIHTNGRVAIGDHAPETILDIKGGGYNSILIGSNRTDNTNKSAGISAYMYTNNQVSLFQMFNQNGSNALYYGSADGAFRGIQQHYFYTNSNYNSTSGHKLRYLIDGSGKHTFYGKHQGDSVGHFLFTNQVAGEDANNTNCSLVVQNGGTFIQIMGWTTLGARIGTRTGGWSSNSGGDVYHTANDATYLVGKSNGTAYLANGSTAVTSDERLKKDITDIGDGQLAKINQLKVRNFKWKDSRKPGTQTGLIAQEVESVISDAIEEVAFASDPDDTSRDFDGDVKIVKYGDVQMRLLKAVQELSAELDAAKARIATLEG